MKSFSAMVFEQGRMISFLLLFLIFGGISKPAYADVTVTYSGPAFNVPGCQEYYNYDEGYVFICLNGNITGSFTFPDAALAAGNGTVFASQFTLWSMTDPLGTLSSSSSASLTGEIYFINGKPSAWDLGAGTNTRGMYTEWEGGSSGGADESYEYDGSGALYALGIEPPTRQPGTWTVSGVTIVASNTGKEDGTPSCSQPTAGNPCSIGSGNKFESVTDYTTSGPNPLTFTRYYNSLPPGTASFATELGTRWRSTYDRYLHTAGTGGAVTVERADGQMLTFTANGSIWTSDSDVDMKLQNPTLTTWVLTDHNNTVETYTQSIPGEAQLQKIVARDGYTQTLAYNAGQLASVTDSYGRTLTFTYNSSGQLTQVATPDALVLTYGYSSSGVTPGVNDQLASVTYNTTPATKQVYAYVNNFDLASITDENGTPFASWTYDTQDRATSSQHGAGAEKVVISYDTDTQRTVTNALGEQTVYTFAVLQGVPKITGIARLGSATVPAGTEAFTYDANGYTASQTDWNGNVTQYINDAHGNPVSITEAAGTPQARTTTITYDPTFQSQPDKIVTPRKTTVFTYDTTGSPVTRTETDTSVASGQTRRWTFINDGTGHMLTATNPSGAVTAYTYTGNNIATVTDALGHVSKITSYNASGLPLSMMDPNGVVTSLAYDVRNRLLSRTVDGAATSFAYDAAGNLTAMTLPDGAQLLYTYDSAHRVTSVKNNLNETITYTLDANDDITQQQIAGATIAKTQTAAFDSLGRMLQQIGAYNETTAFAYDANGNRTATTDALNNATASSFDALNRLISSVDALHNTTAYVLDSQDNLTSVTDPRSFVTTYTYNGFGEVISQTSPDTGTTTYTLDSIGNRIAEKDARNVITNRTFDKLNRVLTESHPPTTDDNVAYTYDAGTFGIGRLTSFKDNSGSTEFTYNARGDILTDKRTIDNKTYDTSYTYDLADHVASITYPSGHTVSYMRDAFGRISTVTLQTKGDHDHDKDDRGTALASNVTYEPFGPVKGFTFGNGVAETFTYDLDYRLTAITASGKTGRDKKTIQSLTMVYDGVNDITTITDAGDGDNDRDDKSLNQTFSYDADYRLLTALGKYGAEAFTYDADGNRVSESATADHRTHTSSYTYASASNQLASIAGDEAHSFTYTANGNLATESGDRDKTFTYDARNRNSAIDMHDGRDFGNAKYLYNALGERVSKEADGRGPEGDRDRDDHDSKHKSFIYDEQGRLIAETKDDGNNSREYVYLNDLPIAEVDGQEIYYIHVDHLGTPQKMTDDHQKIVWSRIAEPFGKTASIDGPATLNLRFPGQYHDAESGLDYNFFRSYNHESGRYVQSDPIGLLAGINTYGYVGQNPLNGIDPWGLDQFGIGIEAPAASAVSHGTLDLSVDTGHTYAYILSDDGQIVSKVSVGPASQIAVQSIGTFLSGNIPATSSWPISGQVSTYQWPINNNQLNQCKAAFTNMSKNPGNYTSENNCTSAAVSLAGACGINVPSGASPIAYKGVGLGNESNPYGLQQQLNKTMTPTVINVQTPSTNGGGQ